jgi:hypothetical protein
MWKLHEPNSSASGDLSLNSRLQARTERNPESAPERLANFNFENRVSIRMLVTPSVVFPLLGSLHLREFTILPVLLSQVDAISAVLLGVPCVIVFTFPIVISPVFSPQRRWANYDGG